MTRGIRSWLVGAFLASAMVGALAAALAPGIALAEEVKVHATRGEIRSIGAGREVIFIAHEEIPGFMVAMTMSFEPREPEQLAGLAVGDRVDFAFTVTPKGRRILTSIARRAAR